MPWFGMPFMTSDQETILRAPESAWGQMLMLPTPEKTNITSTFT